MNKLKVCPNFKQHGLAKTLADNRMRQTMGCPERVIEITRMIHRTDRYSATRLPRRLQIDIKLYAAECDLYTAIYLKILADWVLGRCGYPTTVKRLRRLTQSPRSSQDTLAYCFSLLAKLYYQKEQTHESYALRGEALRHARAEKLDLLELVILANWTIVALELGDQAMAELRSKNVESKLSSLSLHLQDDPYVDEVRGRLAAIRGKILLRSLKAEQDRDRLLVSIQKAKSLYEQGLRIDISNPHRQIHSRVEFADETLNLGRKVLPFGPKLTADFLDEAQLGLHAHTCRPCEAYYYVARSKQLLLEGAMAKSLNVAAFYWKRALELAARSLEIYEDIQHPFAIGTKQIEDRLRRLIEMLERPRKIFLSHSTKDKELVRGYKEVLELLGFEPWLDEEAMTAGLVLERGLLNGMEQSCAAVFFVTSNFQDRAYLATEVEYAIQEKRKKGEQFAIVTLVLGTPDNRGEVPALLRNFVWKEPSNQIEALRELIRALPLVPTPPQWRDWPSEDV
jgi:hypothetical protein